ncbi:hypothetical protein [Psychrobacter pacificensis]|uniref:hypothetical protein n=1 Tax=Psychrobacter pacificensis TaxID=112002 RepID=UPI001CBB1D67|nr:hypothetical protein [Psychrobacter pacificensis]MBZ1392139.1 hypothetical protein [Psychrobacter pacificensis]
MTLATALRIDTAIHSTSRLRWLLYVGLTAIMIVLAWLAALAWWQYLLILTVSLAIAGYLFLTRLTLRHLSQPPLDQRMDKQWQLLIQTSRGDELWQAQLLSTHYYQWAINLEFNIVEPYQRPLSITIFRDQVSPEEWRELSILANINTG